MARIKAKGRKQHDFRNQLVLNQWLISLFGIDPLAEHNVNGKTVRPFHKLAEPIRDPRLEGLDHDNLHYFYHHLSDSPLFSHSNAAMPDLPTAQISREMLLQYEQNIVRHTQAINAKRQRPVAWKYYQWLCLLFVEIYLDRFFADRDRLRDELNAFIDRFNAHWRDYADFPHYHDDDLNKLCIQNATGSGKTLLMHVNLLQYRHYAAQYGKADALSRVILITPNERLSAQHIEELHDSAIAATTLRPQDLFSQSQGLARVDVIEISKLGDKDGPSSFATRSLGAENLLLVDEGHRGLSGKEEGAWFRNRSMLCEKGFTFEYSATFEQAVQAAKSPKFTESYAKAVLFDYSYRWFYEDGFGKDYQIFNLPAAFSDVERTYLTACLLKFYQQLRIYAEHPQGFAPFNLEKPLWVFVGSTVSSGKLNKSEQIVATDVAQIITFIADFLQHETEATRRIEAILSSKGQDTGLLDEDGNDIFAGAFHYLAHCLNRGESVTQLYRDILTRLFNHAAGGHLALERIKGESGEIALRIGTAERPFGLINVGDAKSLCDHVAAYAAQNDLALKVNDSDFSETLFNSVKDSASPINLLIGSKKFVEGWDCWRVSTMGLMHVGRSEGAQIIQLFGRGVRLKGYQWSLKRSGHSHAPTHPPYIEELETLNVFGVEADFMEKFRDFLKEEGLPGNERREIFTIPLNVTYDFGKKLKILRPKCKASDGKEYNFKQDAPVPTLGDIPAYLQHNPVVADWYPRIAAIRSRNTAQEGQKDCVKLRARHLALLDEDALYFELEHFKRERSWYNLNISKAGIRNLLNSPDWYTLYLPETRLNPTDYNGVLLLQQVVAELLKRYCEKYYQYCKRSFLEPRLELRELQPDDDNIPQDEYYRLIVDGDEPQVIQSIKRITEDLAQQKDGILQVGDLKACNFGRHLFEPLLHVRRGGKITIHPVALNDSEYQFIEDLQQWYAQHQQTQRQDGIELYLLRNLSRGRGVGFFEAGGFHPDFILWLLVDGKQYITFIEPHGLLHEGPGSDKVQFHRRIKEIEQRLGDPDVILNSFILSWTPYPQLQWGSPRSTLEAQHILFMQDDRNHYLDKLFTQIRETVPA